MSICNNRVSSPRQAAGSLSSLRMEKRMPLLRARSTVRSTARSISRCRLTGRDSSCSLPASIFEKSRMSSMIATSNSPDSRIRRKFSPHFRSRLARAPTCAKPITAFIGVRISWLMLDRNSLFTRLRRSAFRRACCRSAVRSATSSSRCSR
ncbi:hypothetical protein SDC9_178132 [bioreactor metagenome]|uniref:Uncharacterized protein n=1 Tax=bioreactor metagenome TaxID=1076179 RepID=A0A645GUX3_9ZZZZ